jgi:hypothetical protein
MLYSEIHSYENQNAMTSLDTNTTLQVPANESHMFCFSTVTILHHASFENGHVPQHINTLTFLHSGGACIFVHVTFSSMASLCLIFGDLHSETHKRTSKFNFNYAIGRLCSMVTILHLLVQTKQTKFNQYIILVNFTEFTERFK